jgi:hypothetical protein
MALLPNTGTQMGLNKIRRAFTGAATGTQTRLGADLNPLVGRAVPLSTATGSVFGGRTVPFTYTNT